jgi:K+-sensing histidine kinase KdpD
MDSIETTINTSVNNSLGMLHDVKTAVSIIFRNTESLISEEPGGSIDEKIENASYNKKKLFKSVSLLEERLNMMSLVANPKAATHGERNPMPVYKIFDKSLKLFENISSKKSIKLKLEGTSFSTPQLYSSFTTIPLVLIDNAIKYSQHFQDIYVKIKEQENGINVQVESYSLEISTEDKKEIFKKNVRGKNAKTIAPEGSGLGLYLANIVAHANGFRIYHKQSGSAIVKDGQSYITNTFLFTVPKC